MLTSSCSSRRDPHASFIDFVGLGPGSGDSGTMMNNAFFWMRSTCTFGGGPAAGAIITCIVGGLYLTMPAWTRCSTRS